MGLPTSHRIFRVIREVEVLQMETTQQTANGTELTTYKEVLRNTTLSESKGKICSKEEIILPDKETLEKSPHMQVEYALPDMSREHDGAYAYIPVNLVDLFSSVEAAFEFYTDEDRSAIVYYDDSAESLYTASGEPWEEEEE